MLDAKGLSRFVTFVEFGSSLFHKLDFLFECFGFNKIIFSQSISLKSERSLKEFELL
jgi:hypothetical protein